ncbi:MAG: hypothetical protein J5612_05315 [Paludibacteraceae bacterium]|nr:hypothetical protein [Paludibacteraceae bacterium]
MATVTLNPKIATIHGKRNKDDKEIFRTRNGKVHSYILKNPYHGPLAESRKAAISLFTQATHLCSQEMANPERLAYWKAEYERYLRRLNRRFFAPKDEKRYGTLRGFILAKISAQLKEQKS